MYDVTFYNHAFLPQNNGTQGSANPPLQWWSLEKDNNMLEI